MADLPDTTPLATTRKLNDGVTADIIVPATVITPPTMVTFRGPNLLQRAPATGPGIIGNRLELI